MDLWPDDIGDSKLKPPVAILREQAEQLKTKTQGLVLAEVSSSVISEGEQIHTKFELLVPALEGFRYELLQIRHAVSFYPLDVLPRAGHNLSNYMELENEKRFVEALRAVFGAPEVRRLIHSLVAQAKG